MARKKAPDTEDVRLELIELRKDKARLDWLEAKCLDHDQDDEREVLLDVSCSGMSIREAIDSRMKP